MSFNTNVMGKKFGRGKDEQVVWTCICEAENPRYLVQCHMCGVRRELAKEAQETK